MAPRGGSSGSAERRELLARAAGGDREAQRQVFDSQRPMLDRLARERQDRGLPFEDLLQEGSVGVLSAVQEFARGVETDFDGLAEANAAREMDAALDSEAEALRREQQMVVDANVFAAAEVRLHRELGRAATPAELAAHLKWPLERVEEVAVAVTDARERDDADLLRFIDPDEIDVLDLLGSEDGEAEPNGS